MDPLLRWIRDTPLGHFMRETGNAFPVAEMSHFIGLSLLMGVMIVVDLRLLGVFKQASYSAVLKLLPLAVVGLPGRAPYNIGSAGRDLRLLSRRSADGAVSGMVPETQPCPTGRGWHLLCRCRSIDGRGFAYPRHVAWRWRASSLADGSG